MKNESKKPQVKRLRDKAYDSTQAPNIGGEDKGQIVNNPMGDTNRLLDSFGRAIHRDFVFADTCAKKNPFQADWYKPGIRYTGPVDE